MHARTRVPPSLVLDFAEQGLFGLNLPRLYGGLELSATDTMRVIEQLAGIDLTLAEFVVGHHTSTIPIVKYGAPEFRDLVLPSLAQGRKIGAFALTEEMAGSNPRALTSEAIPAGKDRWHVTGKKIWCGGAAWAGVLTFFARVQGSERGITAFAVLRDTPGLSVAGEADTFGLRSTQQSTIEFRDMPVMRANVLGMLGNGMSVAEDALTFGRLSVGALSTGLMKRCAQLMLRYASRRAISTGLLLDNPVSRWRLARAQYAIAAIETLTYLVAAEVDTRHPLPEETLLILKIAGAELGWETADSVMQLLGGRGYIETNLVPQILRDARFLRIGEGPTETLLMQLGALIASGSTELHEFLQRRLDAPFMADELDKTSERLRRHNPGSSPADTQWGYYLLGHQAVWTVLEACLCYGAPASIQQPAQAWARENVQRYLPDTWLDGSRHFMLNQQIDWTSASLAWDEGIGSLEASLGLPHDKLDPLLRLDQPAPVSRTSARPVAQAAGHPEAQPNRATLSTHTEVLVDLPRDRSIRSTAGERHRFRHISLSIAELAASLQAQVETIVLAGVSTLLYRFSGNADVAFTIWRDEKAVHAAELNIDLGDAPSFQGLVNRVEAAFREPATAWPSVQEKAAYLEAQRLEAGRPTIRRIVTGGIAVAVGLPGVPEVVGADDLAAVDLAILMEDSETGLGLAFCYDPALYEEATIARQAECLQELLTSALADPATVVSQLRILPAEQWQQILHVWNETEVNNGHRTSVHTLVEQQADQTPYAVAVRSGGTTMSYGALERRANRLAHRLQKEGIAPGSVVAICMGRSPALIVSLFAILKAGGCFLVLDMRHPEDRLRWLLGEASASMLLVDEATQARIPSLDLPTLCVEAEIDNLRALPDTRPDVPVGPDDWAYLCFTSGSTGRPKGTRISHAGISNQLIWRRERFELGEGDCVLQSAAPGFDIAVWEYLGPLVAGAAISMSGESDLEWQAAALIDQIHAHAVTDIQVVPSQLRMLLEHNQITKCTGLKHVFCGGEPLTESLKTRFYETLDAQLVNLYGPTEAAIDSTFYICEKAASATPIPIGSAISNKRLYVLDAYQQPVPIGVTGELAIGGVGVAEGYVGQPALTAERFFADPFSPDANGRLYQTGDAVRYRADGALEFLGRVDRQIKVNGIRIEPGEIEVTLCEHPLVDQAVVTVQSDGSDKRMVAYLIPAAGQALSETTLREFARTRLPRQLMPSAFVSMTSFPKTSSGKVDVKALPRVDWAQSEAISDAQLPANAIEKAIATIWAEILSVRAVGGRTDFFEIGGHSLTAAQVLSRVNELFGVNIRLRQFLEAPTVRALAERITQTRAGTTVDQLSGPVPVARMAAHALSAAQRRMWYLQNLQPASGVYNIPEAVRLSGLVSAVWLEQAINEVVRRHESLRTRFPIQGGELFQEIAAVAHIALTHVHVLGDTLDARLAAARQAIDDEAARAFDLAHDFPLRVTLYDLDNDEYIFQWVFHHIAVDGWSAGAIFMSEVSAIYEALCQGRDLSLPEAPIQPIDYDAWFTSQWLPKRQEAQLGYWRRQLDGANTQLVIPTDRPLPAVRTFTGRRLYVSFSDAEIAELRQVARRQNATTFAALLAAFTVVLHRYSRAEEMTIGTPIAGRAHSSVEGVIGNLANMIVLRCDVSGDPTLGELVSQLRDIIFEAIEHGDVPFDYIVEALKPARGLSENPFFQVAFTLYNGSLDRLKLLGVSVSEWHFDPGTAKFDLMANFVEGDQELSGYFEYNTQVFEPETVANFIGHFTEVLRAMSREINQPISSVEILTLEDRQRLAHWNDTATALPEAEDFVDWFEAQVRRTPQATAVVLGEQLLSYTEFNTRANRLANYLRSFGVGPDVPVGICLPRSFDMVVAVMAILKAGGGYMPIDPAYPPERIGMMLADAQPALILTEAQAGAVLSNYAGRVIDLPSLKTELAALPTNSPVRHASADSLGYLLFTSGSTGRPKGVAMPRRALSNLVHWHFSVLPEPARTLQFAALSFDVHFQEMMVTWVTGGSLILINEALRQDIARLYTFICSERIERIFLPFVALQQLAEVAVDREETAVSLRDIITAGEALRITPELTGWMQRLGHCRLHNHYGPTESHVVTAWTLSGPPKEWPRLPPIGIPIANTQIYLVDQHLKPVPPGALGEIVIGGDCLARGYHGRPDLTQERFIPNPFSEDHSARLYRTGDLGRYQPHGAIEFAGRMDFSTQNPGLSS